MTASHVPSRRGATMSVSVEPTALPITSFSAPGLVPGPNSLYETQMLGTMFAAILYGVVLMLCFECFKRLSKKAKERNVDIPSKSMRRFLVFFILVMFLLSTLSLIQGMLVAVTSIFEGNSFPTLPGGAPAVLPFSIWASDGFMLWRCAILYRGIEPFLRTLLLCFISLVWLAAFGSGMSLFFSSYSMRLPTLLIVSFSTILNIIVSAMIVIRLTRHKIYLRKVLGPGHGSPYTRIMAMTVESAALLIIVGIPYVFLVGIQNQDGSMMLLNLLPQICTISPLLIVSRVAKGRAAMDMPSELDEKAWKKMENHLGLGSLRFDSRTLSMNSIMSFPELKDPEIVHMVP
ncbi:hypothetical protein CVT26_010244 [Gymnopilus dilepis]|uniref:G protein-coupled receptor n=1 Tax=Gymnopilus dilepis TaxID=231916 RepID=A0A409Y108_9AGAR|nr:hypothetical protein CVT26_010244 [Gymnopilus dilepis]